MPAARCAAADFATLRPHWDALLAASGSDTVFLTAEWLEAWWRHLRPPATHLHLLAVHDAQGTLTAIAPLCGGRLRQGGLSLRCLRLIGDGSEDSDYLDLIVRRGAERVAVDAIFAYLQREQPAWDVLLLRGMRAASPAADAWCTRARGAGLHVQCEPLTCAAVELPGDWERYLRGVQPRFRTKLRGALRALDAGTDMAVQRCASEDEVDAYLDELFALHQRRWQGSGEPGAFAGPQRPAFYREFARAFLRRGWLGLYRLRAGPRTVAVQIGFEYGGRFFQLQEGFEPECGSASVGITLRAWIVRELIARGFTAYDFLGGFNEYKARWGAHAQESLAVLAARTGLKTRLSLAVPALVESAKQAARRVLPQAVLEGRRRWLEGRRLR